MLTCERASEDALLLNKKPRTLPNLPTASLDFYGNDGYYVDTYPHDNRESYMKTIQMTIDEPLLAEVDRMAQSLKMKRSAFIREALQRALRQYKIAQMEKQDAAGYARYPQLLEEVAIWQPEQVWPDDEAW